MKILPLSIAFKEWSIITQELAAGRQSIVIRKGGIAENGGEFRLEHPWFWLYPTHFHEQQQKGIKPELLQQEPLPHQPGVVALSLVVEVRAAWWVTDLDKLLSLQDWHAWNEATIRQRFAYRKPGVFLFLIQVYSAAPIVEIQETPEYAGCKSWVQLQGPLSAKSLSPVSAESDLLSRREFLRNLLGPELLLL